MFSRNNGNVILRLLERIDVDMEPLELTEVEFDKDNESLLVQRIITGDEEAFAIVVRSNQKMVFNIAYRFLGSFEEAEELTQEVFLRVYRFLRRFEGKSSLRTWIYKITVNSALNRRYWLKRRKYSQQVSLDEPEKAQEAPLKERIAGTNNNPESNTLSRELKDKIQDSLNRLPKRLRIAVILRDIEGLSYEEIAYALGINEGTVKSRIARGRSAVREDLSGYVEDIL